VQSYDQSRDFYYSIATEGKPRDAATQDTSTDAVPFEDEEHDDQSKA
jgi:hypothetical protein